VINRSDSKQAIKEIRAFAGRANQYRFAAVIFPEGTRSRKGAMRQFKPGGFSTLVHNMPEAEIIPAAIDGSWKFSAHRKGPMPFGNLVQFRIGEPISPKNKETTQLLSESYQAVSGMLHEMRLQNPEYQGREPTSINKPLAL
jgi:1-acyl-sn-glycerol-3-phosphate acyltransferase